MAPMNSGEQLTNGKVPVPPNAFYVPSPVVLLSTVNEHGDPDLSAMSAVGVVCLTPPVIAAGIKPKRQTYRNIRRSGSFVVNLPLEHHLYAIDFVGTRPYRRHASKIAESGLSLDTMPVSGLPYVTDCPIVMACEVVGNLGRQELGLGVTPSHQTVLGRITECLVDREWLGDDDVRLEDMPVLLYLNRIYTKRGAVLGEQRFTDEPGKRVEKMREYRSLGIEMPLSTMERD